jgi:uncharacterized protein
MKKLTADNIKIMIASQMKYLRENFKVKKIGIFGSYARGDNHTKSDVDMIVEFRQPIGFFAFVRLERLLSKILGKKVDLVSKRALKPAIKKDVLKEALFL